MTPIKVSQGKTFNNNEKCCAAVRAVDKDLSTNSVTHTDNGAGWLKLDFYRPFFIHRVSIYYYFFNNWYHPSDYCAKGEHFFKSCVDNDNYVDVSVYQGEVKQKSCGTLQLTYGLKQSDQIYTLICNAKGDTVKLSKSIGNLLVAEVVVISTGMLGNSEMNTSIISFHV